MTLFKSAMRRKHVFLLIPIVLFSLLLSCVLTGCDLFKKDDTPTNSDEESNTESEQIPDDIKISEIILGDLRVQLLSETIVRLENVGPQGFEDRPSYIVPNRDNYSEVNYEIEEYDDCKVIKTSAYLVHIPTGGTVENVYITDLKGDKLWAYKDAGNTDTNVYLPSPSDELKSWYFTDSPRIIPSEYGYSATDEVDFLQDWDFDNDALDAFVFLPNGNYEQFCSDYVRVTGSSEMVNLQTLGYWDSRWYAYSSETALQQIIDYREKGYSIDVLVIDTDWRVGASLGYQINTRLFPDMAGFLEECEEMGVDICFNDHPEPVSGTTNILDEREVAYRNKQLTLVLSLGLDYWWYDRNWSVCLNSVDPDISVYAFGMYAYQWITADYRDSITDLNEFAERALIMGNVDGCLHGTWNYASDLSAHRYSIQWTGDIGADTQALEQEIYASVFGGAEVGLPYMSSDIGGHTQAVSDSMYVRWMQYGALSTICRVHCTNASYIGQTGRMPWLFGETAEEVTHSYIDMRYRLLPLFYALSRENYDDGLPIMRRLDINYPEYVESSRNDEYLLGDYILVAPMTEGVSDKTVPNEYLTHMENGKEEAGLIAEYYANDRWTGSPKYTLVEANINHNWGTAGPGNLTNDNFSIKWKGYITIGNKDAALSFFADDAIIVYIDGVKVIDGSAVYDTYLTTEIYKANTKHEIEVHYAEFGYNAHAYMYYVEQVGENESASYNSRTVFIPDGTWIDVWSGERFVGPKTYTVTHPLETSPIFVREGALIALAPNMSNTREKDWSEMVLDVYPSTNYGANITLYEDDTKTDAYKYGLYRMTDITMGYDLDKTALIVKIGAAQGEFTGDLAFTERTWNVRVHTNPGWGDISYVKVNGKVVSIDTIAKSASGVPFAFEGPSLDSDVATFTISGSVYEEYVIEVYYESTEESKMNTSYAKTAIPFNLSVEEAGDAVNLDEAIDWTSYGEGTISGSINKGTYNTFSAATGFGIPWTNSSEFFTKIYKDGREVRSSHASTKDFTLEINTNAQTNYYVLYLGGGYSTCKVTVRDTAGNVRTEYFGNIDGTYLNRVVIETKSFVEGKLYVTYSVVASEPSGTGTTSYVTVVCGAAFTELPEIIKYKESTVTAEIENVKGASGILNLSDAGASLGEETLDWMHFGNDGGVNSVQKINGNVIQNVSFQSAQAFYDYSMTLKYNDGLELAAHTGTTKGTCTPGGITLTFSVNENVKHIILYTGTWNSTNTVYVYTKKGLELASTTPFTAGSTSQTRVVYIAVNATEADFLTVMIKSTNATSNGNVSLAAVAVTGTHDSDNMSASLVSCEEISGNINLDALGYKDWYHTATGLSSANVISNFQTSAGFTVTYNDYDAVISGGSNQGSTSGVAFDYSSFDVEVSEDMTELVLYASVYQATAGITIIDENGNTILNVEPFSSTETDLKSIEIHISLETVKTTKMTVVYYKGGSGSGNAGLAAIAVK